MGKPSSIIKPKLKYRGTAPHIAKSLTVPLTASEPMSPPGKNNGETTKESVVKASDEVSALKTAPSWALISSELPHAEWNIFSIS
jgi:hypothetical protein